MERVKHRRRGRTCGGEARTEKGETTDSRGDRDNGDGDRRQEGSSIGPCTDRVIRHASYLVDGIGQRSTVEGRRVGRRGEARRGEGNVGRSKRRGERETRNHARERIPSRARTLHPPSRARVGVGTCCPCVSSLRTAV